jgi:hypothetical protein
MAIELYRVEMGMRHGIPEEEDIVTAGVKDGGVYR